jgi:uncharacterized tellurite resistance protein B-like protein
MNPPMPLRTLNSEDRMRLMKFVCSFVWADLVVRDEERAFVRKLATKLGLDAMEWEKVLNWLELPPSPEEVDPNEIPRAHRKLFLDTAREVIAADNEIADDEAEHLQLFEALLK